MTAFCFALAVLGVGEVGSAAVNVALDAVEGLVKKDVRADCCPIFVFFVGIEGCDLLLGRFLDAMLRA